MRIGIAVALLASLVAGAGCASSRHYELDDMAGAKMALVMGRVTADRAGIIEALQATGLVETNWSPAALLGERFPYYIKMIHLRRVGTKDVIRNDYVPKTRDYRNRYAFWSANADPGSYFLAFFNSQTPTDSNTEVVGNYRITRKNWMYQEVDFGKPLEGSGKPFAVQASAIVYLGDLVLLDEEAFGTIKEYLAKNGKTEAQVDGAVVYRAKGVTPKQRKAKQSSVWVLLRLDHPSLIGERAALEKERAEIVRNVIRRPDAPRWKVVARERLLAIHYQLQKLNGKG